MRCALFLFDLNIVDIHDQMNKKINELLENSFENHEHDLVEMLLSAVDDEPHEDTYEDLDDIDSLSRYDFKCIFF